jgi:hypothetical protein
MFGFSSISWIRYCDMLAASPFPRTRIVTRLACLLRCTAACPAEFPPPTTNTWPPLKRSASETDAP